MALSSKLSLRYLDTSEFSTWDKFAQSSPQGSVFSDHRYLSCVGVVPEILVVEMNNEIAAGIALPKSKFGLFSTPMFAKHLGVLFAPEISAKRARQAAEMLAESLRNLSSFDYNFSTKFLDWLPFYWNGFAQTTKYTYRICSPDIEHWKNSISANTRNDISHATKLGLSITRTDNPSRLIDLVNLTYQRRGASAPFKLGFLEKTLCRLLKEGFAEISQANDKNGDPIAAICMVGDAHSKFLILSGYDDDTPRGTTSYLIAVAIEAALTESCAFDFEGSMIKPIENFYRGFGGQLTAYHRIYNNSFINLCKNTSVPIAKRLLNYQR